MKKTLERSKNKTYPKTGRSLGEIRDQFQNHKIMEEYGYNLEHDSKFYVGTKIAEDYGFVVFKSQYVVDFIKESIPAESRHFVMDGTFDSLPEGFYQLIIIAVEYKNEVSATHHIYIYFHSFVVHLSVRPSVRSRESRA